MTIETPTRLSLQRELRDEVLLHYGSGRPVVAVDGLDGSGTAAFADGLAEAFRSAGHAVERAGLVDFPGAGDRGDAQVDAEAFRRIHVTPFRRGGDATFRTRPDGDERTAPADTVLIVDGPFLHGPDLLGIWNYSVFLDVPSASAPEEQRRYLAAVRPRTRAVAIVDNVDPERPVRRFADSC